MISTRSERIPGLSLRSLEPLARRLVGGPTPEPSVLRETAQLIATVAATVAVLVLFLTLRLVSEDGALSATSACFLAGMAALTAELFLLRWIPRPRTIAGILALTSAAILLGLALFNGGVDSPALTWVPAIMLFTLFIAGIRWAIAAALLLTAGVSSMFVLSELGWVFQEPAAPRYLAAVRAASLVCEGAMIIFLGWIIDSERRRALQAKARTEEDLWRVVERMPYGVAIYREGEVLYANASLVQALGCDSASEVTGQRVLDLVAPDDRDRARAVMSGREAQRGGGEYRVRRKDGADRLFEASEPVALQRFDNEPASLVVTRDITSERQLQSRVILSDRLASVGSLAAGVAHEINNPLSYVSANLSFVAEELRGRLDEPRDEADRELIAALEEAQHGASRVSAIVRDLKTLARGEQEHDGRGPADVALVLQSAVNIARNEIKRRGVVELDLQPVPFVEASEARLGQVFLNLLLNAAHAIPAGSGGVVRVQTRLEAGRVVAEISDNGCGIPAENLGRVFQPFFTTKPAGVGTGLGLSICQSIVTGCGGEISLSSTPGAGTTVKVVLPAMRDDDTGSHRLPELPEEGGRSAKILIVDGDPKVARGLERLLPGHSVEITTNGREALERLGEAESDYDLVFCDLSVPELNGRELFAQACELQPQLESRFVFMTATYTQEAQAFLDGAPQTRLDKPFDAGAVQRAMAEALED